MKKKKRIKIIKKGKDNADLRYWLNRSFEERLRALEELRSEYIKWKYGNEQGFSRVYRIIKRN